VSLAPGGTLIASSQEAVIDAVETWYLSVPLETPIVLGSLTIATRDFVIVRVRTVDGLEGVAYSLTRGAPLDLVINDVLAPKLLGRDALDTALRHDELTRSVVSLGAVGLVGRGISLIDICLWDLKGRLAALPVWKLLGGDRSSSPVIVVAPYADPDEPDDAYAERIAARLGGRYGAIKLYPLADPAAMARRLAAVRRTLGADVELMVDMAWSWRSVSEAVDAVRSWEDYGLSWVEDPFPSADWQSIKGLSDAVETRIAAGDEVSVEAHVEALIANRAVDVLRMDATSIGGFSRFAALREQAERAGLQVSPHAYSEIHRHCVFAWPNVGPVEIFLPQSPTWGTARFLEDEMDVTAGSMEIAAPAEPGLGLHVDWAAVGSLARRTESIR
jgi:L-alanine-DL-glutamate epimerase-like enolase superfamily enzyme